MMFKHILIATDGPQQAGTAAHHRLDLAARLNAKVTAVTVTEPWMEPWGKLHMRPPRTLLSSWPR
jgi:nucleotide-binding universal stress UspA family protein